MTDVPARPKPTEIVHDTAANTLRVLWDDGSTSQLPVPYLRGWCPCASCQGHGVVLEYHAPDDGIAIASISEVGSYAINIAFADGHDGGIYGWTWLRQIAPESPPRGLKTGRFAGGTFVGGDE